MGSAVSTITIAAVGERVVAEAVTSPVGGRVVGEVVSFVGLGVATAGAFVGDGVLVTVGAMVYCPVHWEVTSHSSHKHCWTCFGVLNLALQNTWGKLSQNPEGLKGWVSCRLQIQASYKFGTALSS